MRTTLDAIRSLKRYVALALDAGTQGPWEVRTAEERGVFHRPFALVQQVGAVQFVPIRASQGKFLSSYKIAIDPVAGLSADDGQKIANDIVDTLWIAFSGPGIGFGHMHRVPLYDYAGVPLTGAGSGVTEAARSHYDYMRIESPPQITPQANESDETLWSVEANIRMSWLRSAAVPSTGVLIQRVPVGGNEING